MKFSETFSGQLTQSASDRALNLTGGHLKLMQIDSPDWTYKIFSPKNIATYPAGTLSDNRQNLNCTGNVRVNKDGDNYIEVWVLSKNQVWHTTEWVM